MQACVHKCCKGVQIHTFEAKVKVVRYVPERALHIPPHMPSSEFPHIAPHITTNK